MDMARINDRIAVFLSVAALLYMLGAYVTDSFLWGLVFALLGIAAGLALVRLLPYRQKRIPLTQFTDLLLLEGKTLSTAYLQRIFPPAERADATSLPSVPDRKAHDETTAAQGDSSPTAPPIPDAYYDADGKLIVNALGYGKVGEEWAAKLYRALKPRRVTMVVAAVDVDRKALSILSGSAEKLIIIHPKEILRRLFRLGVTFAPLPAKNRPNFKTWLGSLSLRHSALFALSAVFSLGLAVWSPVKAYYYVFAAVNALLSIAVVIIKKVVKE